MSTSQNEQQLVREDSDDRGVSFRPSKSIDDCLKDIGLGRYQFLSYFIICLYCVTDGAELIALSFLNVVLKNEMELTTYQISLIGSASFAGAFFGNVLSGLISDNYGRKNIFLISIFSLLVAGNVSAFAENYITFALSIFVYGFCVGILSPLATIMIIEITDVEWRGKMSIFTSSLYLIGEILGWTVSYFTLTSYESGNWRGLLMWVTTPALLSVVLGLIYLDESPRYLLYNDFEKGVELLNKMYRINNGEEKNLTADEKRQLQTYVERQKNSKQYNEGSLSGLFSDGNARITILLWFMWVVVCFVYYGLVYIYPTILAGMAKQTGGGAETDFYPVLVSVLGEIPSYFLSYVMIEDITFGRKNSLIITLTFGGIFCCACYNTDHFWLTMDVFMAKFFTNSAYSFIYPYTSELYHTKHRTTGLGMAAAVSSIGGISMPWITMWAYEKTVMLPFMLFGLGYLVAALSAILMPYDTRGKELDRLSVDEEDQVQLLKG